MSNLIEAIRAIENSKRKMEVEHKQSMADADKALEFLRGLNTVCEKCGGSGKIFYRACAEADREERKCSECGGTGKANHYPMDSVAQKWGSPGQYVEES